MGIKDKVGASPMIEVSEGPSEDRRSFYSTTYSNFHNLGFKYRIDSLKKQQTGYTKNVVPYVHYSKKIDEDEQFRIDAPFLTDNKATFKTPALPQATVLCDKVSVLRDSGFTLMPIRVKNGVKAYEPTIMSSSFNGDLLKFKHWSVNKPAIIPSESAFTNDVSHMKSLGSDEAMQFSSQNYIHLSKNWKDFNVIKIGNDGYSRSTFQDYLKTANSKGGTFPSVVPRGLTEAALYREQKGGPIKLGLKEPTGDVRNNDKPHIMHDEEPNARFTTVTNESYKFLPKSAPKHPIEMDAIKRSGYSLNNMYKYTLPAAEFTKHPTLIKYQKTKERGFRCS